MRIKWKLTVASVKMYFRQREAIIWSILLPLFIVVLFSFVKFGGLGSIKLGVVNLAGNRGGRLLTTLTQVKTFKLSNGDQEDEMRALTKGDRDMVLVIPASYDPDSASAITAYADIQAKPQESQLAGLVLQRVLDEMTFSRSPRLSRMIVTTVAVKTRDLTYIDFLIPGVLAMSIMQMGIFGVAFGFVSLKKRGILRRLWVTPITPDDFIIAQVATRVLVLMLQIGIMVGVGILFLNLHFIGDIASLMFVGLLGAVVFLSFGFALAGISKSEDQVAPIANVVSLPMLLLSGVFFSRSNLPGFVHTITDYLPLTYLADGMRSIAIEGASLSQVIPQLIGLAVWSVVSVLIAVKLFRWE